MTMVLTLPWIVILAGLIYLVASQAGWLDSIGQWSQRRKDPSRASRRKPPRPGEGSDPPARRLEVFEEFLRNLNRDDSQDS
jgi:hypothetical protein